MCVCVSRLAEGKGGTSLPRAPLLERRHHHPECCKQRRAMTAYRHPAPPPPGSQCVTRLEPAKPSPASGIWPATRTRKRACEPERLAPEPATALDSQGKATGTGVVSGWCAVSHRHAKRKSKKRKCPSMRKFKERKAPRPRGANSTFARRPQRMPLRVAPPRVLLAATGSRGWLRTLARLASTPVSRSARSFRPCAGRARLWASGRPRLGRRVSWRAAVHQAPASRWSPTTSSGGMSLRTTTGTPCIDK